MATFWRLLGFLRPYRRGVIASMVLALAAMGMTVLIPWLIGRGINRIDAGDKVGLQTFAIVVVVAGILRLALTVYRRLVAGQVSLGIEQDLRDQVYGHLQELELGFFDQNQTGQLMSRVTVDLQAVRFFLGYGLIFMIQSALTIVLASIAMFIVEPGLAALSLLPVPLVVWVAFRYGHRARPAQQEVQQRIAELTAEVEENISGVRIVKAFAREQRQSARFDDDVDRVFDQAMITTRLSAFYAPLIGFLPQVGLAVVLFLGGRMVIDGTLELGSFVAFYTYLLMLLGPMRTLGMALGMGQRATASGARLFQILDREPRIVTGEQARPLPAGNGHVEFEHVSLTYEHGAEPALRDVTIDVHGGRTVAIVGATASGKTSLVQLIPRLYDVTEGAVRLDGVDVRELRVAELRSAIAVVNDDPFLFSATIAENIAYADPHASREQIEEAARRAQAMPFVEQLPDGLDTRVGERGLTLSGGQRQRLAIARAFLADPRVLILDDATSAVDASTERGIKAALTEVMAGRTTFIIAHRLSTIALADEIIVLEEGELVIHGTHDELLEVSDLYREIVAKGLPDQVFLTRNPLEREVAGL